MWTFVDSGGFSKLCCQRSTCGPFWVPKLSTAVDNRAEHKQTQHSSRHHSQCQLLITELPKVPSLHEYSTSDPPNRHRVMGCWLLRTCQKLEPRSGEVFRTQPTQPSNPNITALHGRSSNFGGCLLGHHGVRTCNEPKNSLRRTTPTSQAPTSLLSFSSCHAIA